MSISKPQIEAHFFGNPRSIADKILFIKRAARLEEYKPPHLVQVQEFGNVWQGITRLMRGERITVIAAGIGPSMIGDVVYALNRPDSVCLYSGTCGGLWPDLEIGSYFIADRAICGDGYSFYFRHLPLSEVAGDSSALETLKSIITASVKRVDCGTAFTTSSIVRESDSDFWGAVSDECQIIEIAAAPFYAAASAAGKRAAAYFWVTDLPTRGKSFFEPLTLEEIRTKQDRYNRSVTLDLELLSGL
jgi:purine-nucleoside phosphorylase